MFVQPDSAQQAVELLKVLADSLGEKASLSQLDRKIYEAVNDIRVLLLPKPFKPYVSLDQAISNYVDYRDELGLARKAWENHEKDIKDEMERISMFLRDKGDELGVDSFNTPSGTAYRNVKISYRIEDWDEFSKWIIETNNAQCLEKRPAKLSVKEIYERDGELPKGLIEFSDVEFNVRRPTKSK